MLSQSPLGAILKKASEYQAKVTAKMITLDFKKICPSGPQSFTYLGRWYTFFGYK